MRAYGCLILLSLILTACRQSERIEVITGEAMGTTYRIKHDGHLDSRDIESLLEQLEAELSTWRADSWVSRFNRAEAGVAIEMPNSVVELIQISQRMHEETRGRFDPAIGSLIKVWGFGAWRSDWAGEPTPEEVESALQSSGVGFLDIRGTALSKTRSGLMLDFSGIAKGYAVDRMAEHLRQAGCRNYLIEFGGDLIAHGHAPGKSGWTVDGPSLAGPLVLRDQAIATSGSEHHFRGGSSHVIDPHAGKPVAVGKPVHAVASSCAEADALATAKLVEAAVSGGP